MSDIFICGAYDRSTKMLKNLLLVLTLGEEQEQKYTEGDILYVGPRVYKLSGRQVLKNDIVQYNLIVVKGDVSNV